MTTDSDLQWPESVEIKNLDFDTAKLIFDQAEKALKEVNDSAVLVVSRITTLLTFTVGFIIALLSFIIAKMNNNESHVYPELTAAVFGLVQLFRLAFILTKNIKGEDYAILGNEPKELFCADFMDMEDSNERRLRIYYNEFVNIQWRIEKNREQSNKRWDCFNRSFLNLILTPILILAVYSFIKSLVIVVAWSGI